MASSIYFRFVFTLSIVLFTINCAPTKSDANAHAAGHAAQRVPSGKLSVHKRDYPTEGILLGKREYPTEGIMLGKREYPTEGILLGRREYPTEGILLGRREYPTEGILLGKRNLRFFAPSAFGAARTR